MNKKTLNNELERLTVEEFKAEKKTPLIVILDNIRSLANIGSVFRTGDAFRIEKVYLCGYTAQPPHREIQKTALGASKSVAWEHREDIFGLMDELLNERVEIYSIEQTSDAIMLNDFEPKKGTILLCSMSFEFILFPVRDVNSLITCSIFLLAFL